MDAPAQDRSGGYEAHPFVAELYDHVVPYASRGDLGFYVELARESGGPVLELGCGTGRTLLPIARAGVPIVGLDLSGSMLRVLERKIAGEALPTRERIRIEQGDMRNFRLEGRFPLVTIPFRAFQHLLTVPEQLSCLRAVREHLAPGGRFVLDLFNPSLPALVDRSRSEEFGEEPEFVAPDGRRVLRRMRVVSCDLVRQVQDVELIYRVVHPDGRSERLVHSFPIRHLFRYEAEHLLARAGFETVEIYSDYERSPLGAHEPGDLVFLARRAPGSP